MIFCTVGTTEFDPLIQAVDALAAEWDEPVIFQIGQGHYKPKHGEWFRLKPSVSELLEQASLVIAHGGFGTTIEALTVGTILVGVPNPDRYDRHQEEILRRFAADGYLVACFDLTDLASAISHARTAKLKRYHAPETTLHLEIKRFLDSI